jgi:prephenate dehydrogenase
LSLEELRKKIDGVDEDIVRLIAQRLNYARQIGYEKRQKHLPVMDAPREKRVIENATRLGLKKGAGEAAVTAIYREIMAACRNAQNEHEGLPSLSKEKALHKERVAVIGATGKMGQWFVHFLEEEGFRAIAAHSDRSRLRTSGPGRGIKVSSNVEAMQECEIIILSVPAAKFESVVREIAPHTRVGQVIIDVSSVRAGPLKTARKYIKKGTFLGVHPMFGPGVMGIVGEGFIITPVTANEKLLASKVKSFLSDLGAEVAIMTPAEHDRRMAVVLALSHFIAHVTADTIARSGLSGKDRASFGTTFKALLTVASAVLTEDPEFYASLQVELADAPVIEKLFRTRAALWSDLVKKGNKDKYASNLVALKQQFARLFPGYEDSYEKMYRVVGE